MEATMRAIDYRFSALHQGDVFGSVKLYGRQYWHASGTKTHNLKRKLAGQFAASFNATSAIPARFGSVAP